MDWQETKSFLGLTLVQEDKPLKCQSDCSNLQEPDYPENGHYEYFIITHDILAFNCY